MYISALSVLHRNTDDAALRRELDGKKNSKNDFQDEEGNKYRPGNCTYIENLLFNSNAGKLYTN